MTKHDVLITKPGAHREQASALHTDDPCEPDSKRETNNSAYLQSKGAILPNSRGCRRACPFYDDRSTLLDAARQPPSPSRTPLPRSFRACWVTGRGSRDDAAKTEEMKLEWEKMFFFCDDPARTRRYFQIIKAVFDNTVEGIVITDANGIIRMVNAAFSTITGYAPEEALGKNPRILKSDRHPPEFYENFWKRLINDGKWEGEIWNRRKNGEVYQWMVTPPSTTRWVSTISPYSTTFPR